MEKFEHILSKYNWIKRTVKPKTTFEKIEHIVQFKLPDDYKIFALNYLAFEAFIGQEFVVLWDFDNLIEMNTAFQLSDYLPKTLGIGSNGSGEYIAIEQTEDDNLRIVLSPFIGINREDHIEIGQSFSDFLERLDNGKKWFQ